MAEVKFVLKDKNNPSKSVELSEIPRYKFVSDKSLSDLIEDLDNYLKLDESNRQFISKNEIKNLLNDFKRKIYSSLNEHEYAYIRTKTLDDIKNFVDNAKANIDKDNEIEISSMFYKSFEDSYSFDENMYIPFDDNFISYKNLKDSLLENPLTPYGKLLKKFQRRGFIVNAVYKDNEIVGDEPNETNPEHWTTEPLGVNNEWPYEWEIHRVRKMININGIEYMIWTRFTYPILKSQYHSGNDSNNIQGNEYGLFITLNNHKYVLGVDSKGYLKAEKLEEN